MKKFNSICSTNCIDMQILHELPTPANHSIRLIFYLTFLQHAQPLQPVICSTRLQPRPQFQYRD